jgi:hypothetical protein
MEPRDVKNRETDLAAVVARAVLDQAFRESLAKDPKTTLRIAGLQVRRDELKAIEKLRVEDWRSMKFSEVEDRIGQIAGRRITRVVITD